MLVASAHGCCVRSAALDRAHPLHYASTERAASLCESDPPSDGDVLEEDEEGAARGELAHGASDGNESGDEAPSSISDDGDLSDGMDVLKYTGKVAARSVYISNRACSVDGCTYAEALKKKYRNKQGQLVPYRQADIEYDVRGGFLDVLRT